MRLMTQTNGNGSIRVCDGKCYNAQGPDCDCICGGLNHGVGFIQAKKNTEELANDVLQEEELDGEYE